MFTLNSTETLWLLLTWNAKIFHTLALLLCTCVCYYHPHKLSCPQSYNLSPSKSMTSHPSYLPLSVNLYPFLSQDTCLSTCFLSFLHYSFHICFISPMSSAGLGRLYGMVTQTPEHKGSEHLVLEPYSGQRSVDAQVHFQKLCPSRVYSVVTVSQGQP